jgi:hypothetical protein
MVNTGWRDDVPRKWRRMDMQEASVDVIRAPQSCRRLAIVTD